MTGKLCFDKGNQSDQYLLYFIFTNQICFLTGRIQKIELNFLFRQVKSNKFIWIFALWKFKQIYLNLCFDKGNQSDQYLQVTYYILSDQICFLTGKIQKIELTFLFWQVKSSNFICISVLTGKIQQIDMNFALTWKFKQIYLNFCFGKGNQSDQYLQVIYCIFQIKFAFWQEKSRKLCWILYFDR